VDRWSVYALVMGGVGIRVLYEMLLGDDSPVRSCIGIMKHSGGSIAWLFEGVMEFFWAVAWSDSCGKPPV
jgi:hypothetical protein